MSPSPVYPCYSRLLSRPIAKTEEIFFIIIYLHVCTHVFVGLNLYAYVLFEFYCHVRSHNFLVGNLNSSFPPYLSLISQALSVHSPLLFISLNPARESGERCDPRMQTYYIEHSSYIVRFVHCHCPNKGYLTLTCICGSQNAYRGNIHSSIGALKGLNP